MPLDEFIAGTIEVLNTDANEIMVSRKGSLHKSLARPKTDLW